MFDYEVYRRVFETTVHNLRSRGWDKEDAMVESDRIACRAATKEEES